jgi:membrane protein DedA with SNARE-associated domain
VTAALYQLGPFAIFLLMVPESACVPIPSELTLMSAGFGVHEGWFGLPIALAAATGGNLAGSLVAYWLGRRGLLTKLPRRTDAAITRCERLLASKGQSAVFTARLLPLARTFVSLPAGHVGVPLSRFVPLTVAGCAIWSAALITGGALAGTGWHAVATTITRVSLLLIAMVIGGTIVTRRRVANRQRQLRDRPPNPRVRKSSD